LRVDCPIYVDEEVLKTSKKAQTAVDPASNEDIRKWLEGLGDEDLGNYKM
jgi:bifunctional DNase/RNase